MTTSTPTRHQPGTDVFTAPHESPIGKPRWATAAHTDDQFCHWYLNRTRTLCGITHEVPLDRTEMHKAPPCPNGNPPCPACVQAYNG